MAFFNTGDIQQAIQRARQDKYHRRTIIRVVHCGNCGVEREHAYLRHGDVPFEFVGTRICVVCGFAPGPNMGVRDKALRAQVLETDGYECVYCGVTDKLAIDHIVPHACGGQTVFENLVTACRSCNSRRKAERTPVLRFGRFRKQG